MQKCYTVTYLYSDESERTFHTICGDNPRPIEELTEDFGKSLVSQPANVTFDAESKIPIHKAWVNVPVKSSPENTEGSPEYVQRLIWTQYPGVALIEVRGGSHMVD